MCNIKSSLALLCCLLSLTTIACAESGKNSVAKGSEYHEVKGKARPDDLICGFNVNQTPMKAILSKLGEPTKKIPDPNDPAQTIFTWAKGKLTIVIAAYTNKVSFYPDGHPIAIAAEGSDPDKFCKMGKGLTLGDSLEKALRIYGKPGSYRKSIINEMQYALTFKWDEEDTDVSIESNKATGITRIEVVEAE